MYRPGPNTTDQRRRRPRPPKAEEIAGTTTEWTTGPRRDSGGGVPPRCRTSGKPTLGPNAVASAHTHRHSTPPSFRRSVGCYLRGKNPRYWKCSQGGHCIEKTRGTHSVPPISPGPTFFTEGSEPSGASFGHNPSCETRLRCSH